MAKIWVKTAMFYSYTIVAWQGSLEYNFTLSLYFNLQDKYFFNS